MRTGRSHLDCSENQPACGRLTPVGLPEHAALAVMASFQLALCWSAPVGLPEHASLARRLGDRDGVDGALCSPRRLTLASVFEEPALPDVSKSHKSPRRKPGDSFCTQVGGAHAPSPDVHYGHPALRSLDGGRALGILPSLAANAGSWGMDTPSRDLIRQDAMRCLITASHGCEPQHQQTAFAKHWQRTVIRL